MRALGKVKGKRGVSFIRDEDGSGRGKSDRVRSAGSLRYEGLSLVGEREGLRSFEENDIVIMGERCGEGDRSRA